MLKKHSQFFKSLMLINDLLFVSLAWWSAYVIRFYTAIFPEPENYVFRHYVIGWFLILCVWGMLFEWLDLYRPRRISTRAREAADLLKGSSLALLVFLGVVFIIREIVLSRLVVVTFWLASLFFLNFSHAGVREGLRFLRRRGYNLRHALIIGAPIQVKRLLGKLQWYRHLGLKVEGIYLTQEGIHGSEPPGAQILTTRDELQQLVHNGVIDQVFITLPLEQAPTVADIRGWLGDEPVTLYFVPDLGGLAMLRGDVEEFDGLHVITLQASPLYGWNSLLKRAMDISLGGLALCVFSPLMALVAIGIKATTPGPVLYRQERTGLDGERFQILKFRTMVEDAEKLTGPVWAVADDPRITPIGRWLRRTSLDELPQLINVLRGEMSLVGPRPERPPLIEQFRKSIPTYMLRQKVKAGMTGLAQVNGWRGNTPLENRLADDLDYIENWSLARDFKILALTFVGGCHKKGARVK